jgi:predicted MFS family arabinose efflux permease
MDLAKLSPSEPARPARGQLREGLRYVSHVDELAVPLLMMTLIGTFAYEFQVVLPVVASHTFNGGATAYGFLVASMGVGAVGGGLLTAARGHTGLRPVTLAASAFAVVLFFAALSPNLTLEYVAMAMVGWASISFVARGNSTIQLTAAPQMRGRAMALWAIAFQGTTPIGAPIIGWITEAAGARAGLATGGASCVAAVLLGYLAIRRRRGRAAAAELPVEPVGDELVELLD